MNRELKRTSKLAALELATPEMIQRAMEDEAVAEQIKHGFKKIVREYRTDAKDVIDKEEIVSKARGILFSLRQDLEAAVRDTYAERKETYMQRVVDAVSGQQEEFIEKYVESHVRESMRHLCRTLTEKHVAKVMKDAFDELEGRSNGA